MQTNKSTKPKYMQIADILREEILSQYVPGDYLPSIRELNQRFGVTINTIRSAIEILVSESLVQTFPYRGTAVLPRRDSPALPVYSGDTMAMPITPISDSVPNESRVIALVMPLSPYLIASIARGVERELRRQNYRLLLCGTQISSSSTPDKSHDIAYERSVLESVLQDRVAGVIWWSIFGHLNRDVAHKLQLSGTPIVTLDHQIPHLACDWVGIDDYGTAFEATNWLLEQGHRRIVMCGLRSGDYVPYTVGERLFGFLDALAYSHVIPTADGQRAKATPSSVDEWNSLLTPQQKEHIFLCEAGEQKGWVARLLEHDLPPTAFIMTTDVGVDELLQTLQTRDLKVPENVEVICFGGGGKYPGQVPSFISIHQPFDTMAQRSVRLLLQRIRDPRKPLQHLHLPTRMIIPEDRDALMPLQTETLFQPTSEQRVF